MNTNMEYLFQHMNRPARRGGFHHKFVVNEAQAGLLYRHGRFLRVVPAGRHIQWGFGWTMNTMDLRKASVLVPGQEVLTADNVALKLSLLVTHQVVDPVSRGNGLQNRSAGCNSRTGLHFKRRVRP